MSTFYAMAKNVPIYHIEYKEIFLAAEIRVIMAMGKANDPLGQTQTGSRRDFRSWEGGIRSPTAEI